jgi:hypothetical protein
MAIARIFTVCIVATLAAACGGGGGKGSSSPPPPPAGSVALSSSAYSTVQSTGLMTVEVRRANGSRDVSVNYATSDGSAVSDTDYVARTGTLTWASGDTSPKTISLPLTIEPAITTDKTFTLTLSNPTNGLTLGTPSTATITIVTPPPPTGSAGGGTLPPPLHKISVSGNRLIDEANNIVQLRGVNFSGFEFVAISGFNPADPSGGQAGQPNGPRWSAIKSWHGNTVRFALNEASWLGHSCVDTNGITRNPDPGANYRSHIQRQVAEATAVGLYVILELHWAAPGNTCPMVQTQMANADHSIDFWKSIATTFQGNAAVLFSLYNEPFFFGLSGGQNEWSVLMNGGTLDYYPASSATFNYKNINTPWTSVGMQTLLDTVRSTGATNVVLIGGVDFSNNMSGWLANKPRDSLNQIAAAWHPYPPVQMVGTASVAAGGTGYAVGDTIALAKPNTVYEPAVLKVSSVGAAGAVTGVTIVTPGRYLQTSLPTGPVTQSSTSGAGSGATFSLTQWHNLSSTWSMPSNWSTVQAISAQVPVVVSETGEHNGPGTVGSPFLQQFLPYAGANNWSVIGCCWNVFQEVDNVLIKDVNGTPTDGYGKVFYDWMTGKAWQ